MCRAVLREGCIAIVRVELRVDTDSMSIASCLSRSVRRRPVWAASAYAYRPLYLGPSVSQAIVNIMRACAGLAPENHMLLEHRLVSELGNRHTVRHLGIDAPFVDPRSVSAEYCLAGRERNLRAVVGNVAGRHLRRIVNEEKIIQVERFDWAFCSWKWAKLYDVHPWRGLRAVGE